VFCLICVKQLKNKDQLTSRSLFGGDAGLFLK